MSMQQGIILHAKIWELAGQITKGGCVFSVPVLRLINTPDPWYDLFKSEMVNLAFAAVVKAIEFIVAKGDLFSFHKWKLANSVVALPVHYEDDMKDFMTFKEIFWRLLALFSLWRQIRTIKLVPFANVSTYYLQYFVKHLIALPQDQPEVVNPRLETNQDTTTVVLFRQDGDGAVEFEDSIWFLGAGWRIRSFSSSEPEDGRTVSMSGTQTPHLS